MKLSTKTRKRIRTAGGKPVKINWPQGEGNPDCRSGHKYPIYNEKGRFAFKVRVVSRSGSKATVRIDDDPVRRLPGLVGQRDEAGAYEDEPERVPASYERQLAVEALWSNRGAAEARRENDRRVSKEQSVATTDRSKRAKERHLRGMKAA